MYVDILELTKYFIFSPIDNTEALTLGIRHQILLIDRDI